MGVSQCPDTLTQQHHSAELKMMKLVFVAFSLTLMAGDIVGKSNREPEPPIKMTEISSEFQGPEFQRQRQGRQSILGCMMGCTRELRPVRGEQGDNERLFANKCAFNIERCRAQVQRKPQLVLSSDQSEIHWPTVN